MSDFVDRLAQKRAKTLPTIPGPSEPMAVARRLVKDLFTAPEGVETLRAHRGDFYRWNRQCWSEMKLADVRKTAYQYLEHAHYIDPKDGKRKPFAPTRRKMDDVLDALRAAAVVLLDSSADEPTWIDDRAEFAADQIIAMRMGSCMFRRAGCCRIRRASSIITRWRLPSSRTRRRRPPGCSFWRTSGGTTHRPSRRSRR